LSPRYLKIKAKLLTLIIIGPSRFCRQWQKYFEKVLAMQITRYFERNKLFTPHQHGFRKGHSCETALHELISDLNLARDKK
jgi:hypothetical protein